MAAGSIFSTTLSDSRQDLPVNSVRPRAIADAIQWLRRRQNHLKQLVTVVESRYDKKRPRRRFSVRHISHRRFVAHAQRLKFLVPARSCGPPQKIPSPPPQKPLQGDSLTWCTYNYCVNERPPSQSPAEPLLHSFPTAEHFVIFAVLDASPLVFHRWTRLGRRTPSWSRASRNPLFSWTAAPASSVLRRRRRSVRRQLCSPTRYVYRRIGPSSPLRARKFPSWGRHSCDSSRNFPFQSSQHSWKVSIFFYMTLPTPRLTPGCMRRTYHLQVVQQPIRSAEFASTPLSRLPLAPPPIVQLTICNSLGSPINP